MLWQIKFTSLQNYLIFRNRLTTTIQKLNANIKETTSKTWGTENVAIVYLAEVVSKANLFPKLDPTTESFPIFFYSALSLKHLIWVVAECFSEYFELKY